MKKTILFSLFIVLSKLLSAQTTATVVIQFYVDANNNCTYNVGEQLIYNVNGTLNYMNSSNSFLISSFTNTGCAGSTLFLTSPSPIITNTLSLISNGGISPNLSCGNYTNIPYNTNTTQYLPVTITNTINVGTNLNTFDYYVNGVVNSVPITSLNSTSMSFSVNLCNNFSDDSLNLTFISNCFFGCNSSLSLSPRTYSLFLDGVNYDILTLNGGFQGAINSTGINTLSKIFELYDLYYSYTNLKVKLPPSFKIPNTHTFEVKSSLIYNHPATAINFSSLIQVIPCMNINGKFYNDWNNNCVFDSGDNYGVDWNATGFLYNSSGYNLKFHPSENGDFSLFVPSTSAYSLTQYPSISTYTACTTGTLTIPIGSSNSYTFGYKGSSIACSDPGVSIHRAGGSANAIPGSSTPYGIYITKNLVKLCPGASPLNPGKAKFVMPKIFSYKGPLTGPTPTFVSGSTMDTLIWDISDFTAISNTVYVNYFATFSLVLSPTVTLGTKFTLTGIINPTYDNKLSNNIFVHNRECGGPYDPNLKQTEAAGLLENGDVPFGTKQFYYTIDFQNIGTAPAVNVLTLDTIDNNFDLNSLVVVQSSYPVRTQINQNSREVAFMFNGINLIDSATNEPKSHGFVKYGIKLNNNVPAGTILKNRAHNYFDYNEPVPTNQTSNKLIVTTILNKYGEVDALLKAFPNPFSNQLKISSEKTIKTIKVFNTMGALIIENKVDVKEVDIDFDQIPSGLYIISVELSDKIKSTIKVIKQ